MFEESNKVILRQMQMSNPTMGQSKIKDINNVMEQLLEPFKECRKYTWGTQIYEEFKEHFTGNFEMLWRINREQFYEFLLLNCQCKLEEVRSHPEFKGNYQDYLYDVAIQKIEDSIPDNLDLDRLDLEKKMDFVNASILDQEFS